MMWFIYLFLAIFTCVRLILDPQKRYKKWECAAAGLAGLNEALFAGWPFVWQIRKSLAKLVPLPVVIFLGQALSSVTVQLLPFALLCLALSHSGFFKPGRQKRKLFLATGVLLPMSLMYGLAPLAADSFALYSPDFLKLVACWAIPCMGVALVWMGAVYFTLPGKRQEILQSLWIILVPVLHITYMRFMYGGLRLYRIPGSWVMVFGIMLFVFLGVSSGIMGFRLRFQRTSLEHTLTSVANGSAALNQIIKSEILKIIASAEALLQAGADRQQIAEHKKLIADTAGQMLAVVSRIHAYLKDIRLEVAPQSLQELVKSALQGLGAGVQPGQINIQEDYTISPVVLCDCLHTREVIINILKNALEAMAGHGEITIQLYKNKGKPVLAVSDSGPGILPAHLARVYEPFFSTKKDSLGLGLPYCYQVMQKQAGTIRLESREGRGTTVYLGFKPAMVSLFHKSGGRESNKPVWEKEAPVRGTVTER